MTKRALGVPVAFYMEYGTTTEHELVGTVPYYSFGFRIILTSKYQKFSSRPESKAQKYVIESFNGKGVKTIVPLYSTGNEQYKNSPFSRKEALVLSKYPFEKLNICSTHNSKYFGQLGVFNTNSEVYNLINRYLLDYKIPYLEFDYLIELNYVNKIVLVGGFATEEKLLSIIGMLERDLSLDNIIDYCALERKINGYRSGSQASINQLPADFQYLPSATLGEINKEVELLKDVEPNEEIEIDISGDEVLPIRYFDAN